MFQISRKEIPKQKYNWKENEFELEADTGDVREKLICRDIVRCECGIKSSNIISLLHLSTDQPFLQHLVFSRFRESN